MNATLIVKIIFFFIFLSITTKTKKNKKVFLITKNNIHKEVDIPVNSTKFQISIAYSTDNKFLYPTLVSITSLLENIKYNKTFYDIYIMITDDFENKNKNILESVEKRYPRQCKINFIEMGNMFNEQKVLPASKYYRLALPVKLPNINKIIYLDGDTMIFEDLTELFNLNMKGYYILGFLDSIVSDVEKYGIKNATVLCTGVLLMDLEGLRNFNSTEKFKQFMISHNNQFDKADQNVINAVLQGHIHTLPPKYGMWGFDLYSHAKIHNNVQRPWLKYNESELKEAFEHPAILHYTASKPFKNKKAPFDNVWWHYANKTGYYESIYNYSLN